KRDYNPIPALRMIQLPKQDIHARAQELQSQLSASQLRAELVHGESLIGGGAAPSSTLPTILLPLARHGLSANELEARLRASDPPVIARVEEGKVLLDLRTVFPEQDEVLRQVLAQAAAP